MTQSQSSEASFPPVFSLMGLSSVYSLLLLHTPSFGSWKRLTCREEHSDFSTKISRSEPANSHDYIAMKWELTYALFPFLC